MKIYKDTYPGFDSQSAIDAEIQKATNELKVRRGIDCEQDNIQFESAQWARDIADKVINGHDPELEFIDKTKEESNQEKADEEQIKAEIKAEEDRNALLVQAKTDPVVRDKVIRSEMSKAGFTPEKDISMKIAKDWDGDDITEYKSTRAAARQNIIDMIDNA